MKQVFRSLDMTILGEKNRDKAVDKRVRERLLDAAEELFCERGFGGTSVRDLAAAAKCNVASVNYYFGGKENLYIELWRGHLKRMREARLESIQQVVSRAESFSLEQLLRAFAQSFMGPLVDQHKAHRLIRLMAREMIDEHLPANMFIDEVITPTMAAMGPALLKACPNLGQSKVPLLIFSIAGQLVHLVRIHAMFGSKDHAKVPGLDMSEAVEHIVKFSAAGIRAYAEEKGQ
jgi:AcrR family transcriptional regulator